MATAKTIVEVLTGAIGVGEKLFRAGERFVAEEHAVDLAHLLSAKAVRIISKAEGAALAAPAPGYTAEEKVIIDAQAERAVKAMGVVLDRFHIPEPGTANLGTMAEAIETELARIFDDGDKVRAELEDAVKKVNALTDDGIAVRKSVLAAYQTIGQTPADEPTGVMVVKLVDALAVLVASKKQVEVLLAEAQAKASAPVADAQNAGTPSSK